MDALQHDYYYWRLVHHYVVHLGFRLIEQRDKETWLEDDSVKPRRFIRIVRVDVNWANPVKKDIRQATVKFEYIRKKLGIRELVGDNMYVTVYPPIDTLNVEGNPSFSNQKKKTTVYSSLIVRHGQNEIPANRELSLPLPEDLDTVEELQQAIIQKKQEVIKVKDSLDEEEKKMFSFGKPIATYALLFSIALMFFVIERNGGSTHILTLIQYGAKYNPLIVEGEWWRFFSAMFLHIGFLHLFMNSLALFYLGGAVERMYGTTRFLLIYFIAGLSGSLASFAFNDSVAAGASGAIFGCFGALLYFGTVHKKLFFRTMGKNVLFIITLNLIFGFSVPMIDNGAHIGGLIGGFLASAIVQLPQQRKSMKQMLYVVVTGVVLIALFIYGTEYADTTPSPQLSLQIGQEYLTADEVDKAYPYLKSAFENGVDTAEGLFLLAYAEATFENYAFARDLLIDAIQKRDEFHEAHYNLALIYIELGQMDEAKASVKRAVDLDDNNELYLDLQKKIDEEMLDIKK